MRWNHEQWAAYWLVIASAAALAVGCLVTWYKHRND